MPHGNGSEVGRRISWLIAQLMFISFAAFSIVAAYLIEGAELAGQYAATFTFAFGIICMLAFPGYLLTYNDFARKAASRILPKRWLGMEAKQ